MDFRGEIKKKLSVGAFTDSKKAYIREYTHKATNLNL